MMSNRNRRMSSLATPIYLFVEGEKSETVYFEILRKQLEISSLKILHKGGKSGNALLNAAKNEMNLNSSLDPKAIKYLVFDKDAMTKEQLDDILIKATEEGFEIAFSNLNFEVWLLSHFEKLTKRPTSPTDKIWLEKELTKKLNQSYKKGDRRQLEKIVSNYEIAIKNASAVCKVDFDYQCTTIGVMIKEIVNERTKSRKQKGGI